jgi:hypothetical protein
VRAAVLERAQCAFHIPGNHHRHVADEGGEEAARLGELRFQAQVVPGRPVEDAPLLLAIAAGLVAAIPPTSSLSSTAAVTARSSAPWARSSAPWATVLPLNKLAILS